MFDFIIGVLCGLGLGVSGTLVYHYGELAKAYAAFAEHYNKLKEDISNIRQMYDRRGE